MRLVAMLGLLLLSLPVLARERAGVTAPELTMLGDKELKLNGLGLRKKAIFKVYVAALYVETRSKDAQVILGTDQIRRVEMTMLRDLDKGKIIEAVREGFEKNNGPAMPKLQARLDKFVAVIPDLKENDKLTITYVPGVGTSIAAAGGENRIVIEGRDFGEALFSVWLGKEPVSEGLREELLGKDE